MESQVLSALLYFIPFLLSLCIHEWAHAQTASWLGDDTAQFMGRLTLNPLKHADPIGTLLLPLMALMFHTPFFGWAKPVPVNPRRFKHPTRDMAIVAAAGPISNLVIAICFAIAWRPLGTLAGAFHPLWTPMHAVCVPAIWINLYLAIFNLIPVPPLDGSRIVRMLLPSHWVAPFDRLTLFAPFVLIFLLLSGVLRLLVIPVQSLFGLLQSLFM